MHRSASMVVGALHARSAVGHQSASTVVGAMIARSAVGDRYASTVVGVLSAKSAVGHKSASTVVSALSARSAVGVQSASTVVSTFDARSAGRPNDIGRLVKRRPNRDSGIAPRFIVNFYQLYRLLDRAPWVKNGKKSSIVVVSLAPLLLPCPPPPPPSSHSLTVSQPLPGQLVLAAPRALRRLTPDDRPERHTRGHPAAFARSLPDPHLPSPQRVAPLIRGDPASSGRHRERLALVSLSVLELLASDGHR